MKPKYDDLNKEIKDSVIEDARVYLGFLFIMLTAVNAVSVGLLPFIALYNNMLESYPYMTRYEVAQLLFGVMVPAICGGAIMLWLSVFIWTREHGKLSEFIRENDGEFDRFN